MLSFTSATISVDPTSKSCFLAKAQTNFIGSLAAASKTTIEGMLSYYGGGKPGGTPGIFNEIEGYYWWMAGAAWNVPP